MSAEWRPRFFWRRVFALLVDYLLAFFVTLLVLFPFHNPDENGLRLADGPLRYSQCFNVTSVTPEISNLVAPAEITAAKLCENWTNFIYNGRTLDVTYGVEVLESGWTRADTLRVWLDGEDRVVAFTFEPQDAMILLAMIFAGAGLLARGRRTPGKALLGLRIQGDGCAMCREVRRLGPLLLLSAISLVLGFFDLSALLGLPVSAYIAAAALIALPFLAYYILPLLYWNGTMPWDKAAGYTVERV